MKGMFHIALKELKSYFLSPVAYVVLTVFLGITGFFFYSLLIYMQHMQAGGNPYMASQVNINDMVLAPLFGNMGVVLLLMVPVFTMRLIAEERKSRTFDFLFTSPISTAQITMGKLLGAILFFLVMLLCTIHYPLILVLFGEPDIGPLLASYFGILLLGASYISVGLLASSLTVNQILAALVSFGILLIFWVISWASQGRESLLSQISLLDHFEGFTKGYIDSKDVVFYLTFTAFFSFLSYQRIESFRWR